MPIQRVGAMRGWHWMAAGFATFRKSPLIWIVFVLILFLVVQAARFVPFLGAALLLLYPSLLAGFMTGCADLERGRELDIAHLFAGFHRKHAARLFALGGVNLVGNVLVVGAMLLVGGQAMVQLAGGPVSQTDSAALEAASGRVLAALLFATASSVPLLMAIWFAPLLVIFGGANPFQALKLSFLACWRNVLPFLGYGVGILGLIILASLPFGLTGAGTSAGVWIALPFVLPSIYAAYRDIFRDVI
ncbi:MAG TPA: BPSS1780 family membrane protein [Burkholderiales bacterium]|nr:BPSS1780 family membrane protein [Burkholderiales bacterium]